MHHDDFNGITGPMVAVHAGAGTVGPQSLQGERRLALEAGLAAAVEVARLALQKGAVAMDAALAAVRALEANPLFNAGYGAVLCADGTVELSASAMRGADRACGAVAGLRGYVEASPVAVSLLQHQHVLLVGDAAARQAASLGMPLLPPGACIVPERQAQLERVLQAQAGTRLDHDGMQTVGAVVRDSQGQMAALTSTGGLTGQLPGRVGDSPIPGHGTWADDRVCAVSATGTGEAFMRSAFARHLHDRMQLAGESLASACAHALDEVGAVGGEGGCIALGAAGDLHLAFSSSHMLRGCWWPQSNDILVGIGEGLHPYR